MIGKTIASGIILSTILIGCGKKNTTPAVPTEPKAEASNNANQAMTEAQNAANSAGAAAKNAAKAAGEASENAANSAEAAANRQTPPPTDTAVTPANAQSKLTEAMDDISNKNYDVADKLLTQLENNKANLPAAVASQLPAARTALNSARASGTTGNKLPGQ